MYKKSIIYVFLFVLSLTVTGCQPKPKGMIVENAWARVAGEGTNSAAYFVITNRTDSTDELIGASSSAATNTEIHLTSMQNGVMKMQPQESVQLPLGESVEFRPQGLHVMMINLNQDLVVGDDIQLTLKFKHSEDVILTIPVKEPDA